MISPIRRLVRSLLTLAAPIAPALAQSPAVSAPIGDVRYDVTFDSHTAAQRTLKLRMTFTVTSGEPVLLSLPAWTPGAYEITNFARWVFNFAAAEGSQTLAWDKFDPDTWRVRPSGSGTVAVTFDYRADTLDNAMAWSASDFALFNGTNVFLYAEGRPLDFASTVMVHTEPTWKVATGMPAGGAKQAYTTTSYHELVDHPFFIGRFDLDSAQIAGKWIRLSTYPSGSFTGAARATLWDQEKKIFPAENAIFRDVPYATYDVMIIFDSTSGGGSALEHQNSHVGIYSPMLAGSVLLPSITAHEQFHLWNVKRLRPTEMWPYQYDRPQPTPWLWVSEGITDYYADLALVRPGVIDSSGFLQLTQGKMSEVAQTPPVALEDASIDTWIHPTDGTGYIYYQKGSLAGFLLDILVRDASDNAHSLDDVMRELYQGDYKRGKGFTFDEWWGAVSRAANGKSFDDFYRRYVDGREPFPYASVLPLAGFRLRADTLREPRLGVQTSPDSTGVKVIEVDPTSAASAAGLRAGDHLVKVGDIDVSDPTFGPRFRERYARRAGESISVIVRRDGQTLTLPMKVQLAERVEERLEFDAKASARAAKIRHGILTGT